jgi:hypothetical protein
MTDDAGALLYVGITCSPGDRFANHRRGQPWWPKVTNIAQHFPDRMALENAERVAIRTEYPRYNKTCYVDPPDDWDDEWLNKFAEAAEPHRLAATAQRNALLDRQTVAAQRNARRELRRQGRVS